MTILDCIDDYVGWCELKRMNIGTVERKKKLLTALSKEIDLSTISKRELEIQLLKKYKDYSPKTFNNILSTIRMFYEYCNDNDLLDHNPAKKIDFLENEFTPQPVFSVDEVKSIIESSRFQRRSRKEHEMYTLIFSIIAFTGMRKGEAIRLLKNDLICDPQRPYIIIRTSKNKQGRICLLPVGFDQKLKNFSDKHSKIYLFESRLGTHLAPQSVGKAFQRRLKQLGLYKHKEGLHALRRFYITSILNRGGSLQGVARLVGHKKIDTTMLYYYHSFEYLREVASLNPLFSEYEKTQK